MRIIDAIKKGPQPFVSLEFFPPANDEALPEFYETVEKLSVLSPKFASVTYGAGGSKQSRTLAVAKTLADTGLNVMSHLTCVGASPTGILEYVRDLRKAGIDNILALRGDPPKGVDWSWTGPFRHASDLVSYVRMHEPEMGISVAGYPCPHPESETYADDRTRLLQKLDAGADFVVTQLFFDAREYFDMVDTLRGKGCDKPVIPGILPIQSLASLRRVISMCGVDIPAKLYMDLEAADARGGAEEVRKVGIEYAVNEITRLLVGGAPGIHLYTLNKADLCLNITKAAGLA